MTCASVRDGTSGLVASMLSAHLAVVKRDAS